MKKLLFVLALFLPSIALAVQISVPSAPAANYFLVSTSTGQYISTSTLDARFIGNSANADWAGTWQTFSPSHFQVAGSYLTLSSLSASFPINYNSGTGAFTWTGFATTSQPASSNLIVSDGGKGIYGVATSTLTPSSPLTGSFTALGGTLGIQNASASQGGAIQIADYNRLYAPTTTFSGPLSYSLSTNAVTCPTCATVNGVWPWPSATTFGTTTNATTTPTWFKTGFYASSTAGVPSQADYLTMLWATSTQATTTSLAIIGLKSSVLATNAAGGVIATTSIGWNLITDGSANPTGTIGATTATNGSGTNYMRANAVPGCQAASGSQPGCLSSVDWTTFNGKLNLSNLFTSATTFSTTTLATTTPFWFQSGLYASSTVASSSRIDYLTMLWATSTQATTTALAITAIPDSLLSTTHTGGVVATTSIGNNLLVTSGVAAGSYTNTNLTVNAQGIITTAANGSAGAGAWPFVNGQITFSTTTVSTSTPEWFRSGLYASSTAASSSRIDYLSMLWSTTSQATTTSLAITGLLDSILATNHAGGVTASTSIGFNLITGIVPNTQGGTGQNSSSWTGVGAINSGVWQVYATSSTGTLNTLLALDKNQFTTIPNASSTNVTASQSLFIASKQVNPYQNATFSYGATSTAWTGTTTETTLVAPFAGTLQDVQCSVPTGTLNVQVKVNSTAVTPMFNGSSTRGTITFTGSNTFVRGDIIEFDFGTPASSPNIVTCTPRTTVTSF